LSAELCCCAHLLLLHELHELHELHALAQVALLRSIAMRHSCAGLDL